MCTDWEKAHILDLKDIRFARRFFKVENLAFWHLTSIAAPRISLRLLPLLDRVDGVLTKIPGLQLMCWIFTFELVKPAEE
jgi:hypothetical protein